MADITWPSVPSGTSNVGLSAGDLRRAKKALNTGLAESCNFQDQVNPVKQGAAPPETKAGLPLFDNSDATINWEYEYKPVIDSQTSRMYSWQSVSAPGGFNSFGTFLAGAPDFIDMQQFTFGSETVDISDSRTWVELWGNHSRTTVTVETIPFGLRASASGFQFDAIPMVFITTSNGSTTGALCNHPVHVSLVSTGGFNLSTSTGKVVTPSNVTVLWCAFGWTKGAV